MSSLEQRATQLAALMHSDESMQTAAFAYMDSYQGDDSDEILRLKVCLQLKLVHRIRKPSNDRAPTRVGEMVRL